MSEAKEIVEEVEDLGDEEYKEEAKKYLDKFSSLKPEKAKELREELEELDILRLKDKHIVKIIDILPETASEINKISPGLALDEEENNKILEIVKKYK